MKDNEDAQAFINTWTEPDQTRPEFILHALPQTSYFSTYSQRNDAAY